MVLIWLLLLPTLAQGVPLRRASAGLGEDSILIVTLGGKELTGLSRKAYTNPMGTRVHVVRARVARSQLGEVGLLLHLNGARRDVAATLLAVSGVHMLHQESKNLVLRDLILMPAYLAAPQDCGGTEPCLADRIVVDMRLQEAPTAALWICHLLLVEDVE